MLVSALFAAVLPGLIEPVELYRQWSQDDKLEYSVTSRLQVESRDAVNRVYMPEITRLAYKFTIEVNEISSEGFAKVDYLRPTMVFTLPETATKKAYDEIEEVNEHFKLTLSPVNAITDFKDLTPKKDDDDGDGGGVFGLSSIDLAFPGLSKAEQQSITGVIANITTEFYRLANFTGNLDTMLDFSPRLSLFEVEPGETWEHTASYQPQPLDGKPDKMAPQRIDYTLTYVGVQEVDGRKIHRVTSDLTLDTDVAPFLNGMLRMTPAQSGLTGFKMTLTAHIDFDLDFETKHTLRALAISDGHLAVSVTDIQGVPFQEIKVRGRTLLKLVPGADS